MNRLSIRSLPARRRAHGAVALVVALTLLGAMLLVLAAANRGLLLELRMATNQVRSTTAFEAAEAGLEWASAQLNTPEPLARNCRIDTSAATTFRDRYLASGSGGYAVRTWTSAGVTAPLQPACTHGDAGWSCDCPTDSAAAPAAAEGPGAAVALQFLPGSHAGLLRVIATGCDRLAAGCTAATAAGAQASARAEVLLALLPALSAPPATALTLRAAGVDADPFFVAHFGLSKRAWKAQTMVRQVDCGGECSAALSAAIGPAVTRQLVWIEGDLLLQGPVTLGTPERPVLIAATGSIRLQGPVALNGVLYGNSIAWSGATAPLRGALISETTAGGDNVLDLQRDAALLDILRTRTGSLVRVPGGWRDF